MADSSSFPTGANAFPLTLDEPEECFDCGIDDEERELYDYPTLAGCVRLCGECSAERREQDDGG